jgi:hypothetical protein
LVREPARAALAPAVAAAMVKKRAPVVNFNTNEFRAQWGFLPRGQARWGFYFADAPGVQWFAFDTASTYQQAKQVAIDEARKRGVHAVRVEPNPHGLRLIDE